jgi:hypothetical protein
LLEYKQNDKNYNITCKSTQKDKLIHGCRRLKLHEFKQETREFVDAEDGNFMN